MLEQSTGDRLNLKGSSYRSYYQIGGWDCTALGGWHCTLQRGWHCTGKTQRSGSRLGVLNPAVLDEPLNIVVDLCIPICISDVWPFPRAFLIQERARLKSMVSRHLSGQHHDTSSDHDTRSKDDDLHQVRVVHDPLHVSWSVPLPIIVLTGGGEL